MKILLVLGYNTYLQTECQSALVSTQWISVCVSWRARDKSVLEANIVKRAFYCHTGLTVWGQRRRSVIQDVWELALVPEREREVVQLSHLHSRLGGSGEGSAREGRHRSLLSRTRYVLSTHNLPTLLCLAPLVRRCCQLFSLPRPYKPLRHISSRLPRGMRRIRDLTHFRESSFIFSGGESK